MVVTSASSGLVFVNTFAAGVSAAYESCAIAAENALQALATNSDTVYVTFDTTNNGPHGDLATNDFTATKVSFSQLKSALASHENSAIGAAAVASLNGLSDPSGGAGFQLPTAYAVMLGLAANPGTNEETVNLNIGYPYVFGQDVTNTLEHELSEGVLGRIGGLGDANWRPMDLFRFNSSGQRDYQDGRDGVTTYFSYDGGSTTSESAGLSFNNRFSGSTEVNKGDIADFTERDVFGTGGVGETNSFSQTDLQILQALGWNPVVPPPTYANDFDGLGVGDILWTNGGQLGVWVENSSLNPTWELLSSNTNGWSVVGSGDYNGDGINDILWQNGNQLGVWTENGNLAPTWTVLSSNISGWSVVGGGDYTGSGTDDILWANGNQLGIWLMNSSLTPTWDLLDSNTNGWSVVGSGDYNGDGISDILFENGNQVGVWTESSNLTPTWTLLSSDTNGWSVVGSGDYTGSGVSDILWQNGNQVGVWIMNRNSNPTPTWHLLSSNTNGWSVVGSADYNSAVSASGHTISDILWQNGNQVGVWIEDGNLNPTWYLLNSNTNGWTVTGAGSPAIR